MKFLASVKVLPLKELLDPQGKAVKLNMPNVGIQGIEDVRIGRHIELTVEANDRAEAEQKTSEACEKLLHNKIMEYFQFELEEVK